jgi:hypothetical protein
MGSDCFLVHNDAFLCLSFGFILQNPLSLPYPYLLPSSQLPWQQLLMLRRQVEAMTTIRELHRRHLRRYPYWLMVSLHHLHQWLAPVLVMEQVLVLEPEPVQVLEQVLLELELLQLELQVPLELELLQLELQVPLV